MDKRQDGWTNLLSGIGDATRDKRASTTFVPNFLLPPSICRSLYEGDFFAYRAAAVWPEEALRAAFRFKCDSDPLVEEILEEKICKNVGFLETFSLALQIGLAEGGSLLWPVFEDALNFDAPPLCGPPVMGVKIKKWKIIHRENVGSIRLDNWGDPKIYSFSLIDTGDYLDVSASRLVRLPGATTTPMTQQSVQSWDCSIYQRIYEILRDSGMALSSVSLLLQNPHQTVYKMQGLAELFGQADQQTILTRIASVEAQRSAARPVVIDKEDEFSVESGAFSGVDSIIDRQMYILSSALGVPVAILFGRSAAGLNATGEADFKNFFTRAATYRAQKVFPYLMQCARFVLLSANKVVPGDLEIIGEDLYAPSETERASSYATRATADVAYIQAGVLSNLEVRSRFEGAEEETGIELSEDTSASSLASQIQSMAGGTGGQNGIF